jgi:hypothetical protein
MAAGEAAAEGAVVPNGVVVVVVVVVVVFGVVPAELATTGAQSVGLMY